jgi:hypothetical protein
MTRNRGSVLISLLVIFSCAMAGVSSPRSHPAILASGCDLLGNPVRYTGKMVRVSGLMTVGFERSDLTFDGCGGYITTSLSLYDPDLKKYGFLTDKGSKAVLSDKFGEAEPGSNLLERKNKSAHVTVVGLFRCHYDFPTCKDVSRSGDSSIVLKSVLLDDTNGVVHEERRAESTSSASP